MPCGNLNAQRAYALVHAAITSLFCCVTLEIQSNNNITFSIWSKSNPVEHKNRMKVVNFQLSSAFCPEFTCAAESSLL